MAYLGVDMKEMCIQKAYGLIRKRGYNKPINTVYWVFMGVLDRDGEDALYEYAKTVNIEK